MTGYFDYTRVASRALDARDHEHDERARRRRARARRVAGRHRAAGCRRCDTMDAHDEIARARGRELWSRRTANRFAMSTELPKLNARLDEVDSLLELAGEPSPGDEALEALEQARGELAAMEPRRVIFVARAKEKVTDYAAEQRGECGGWAGNG